MGKKFGKPFEKGNPGKPKGAQSGVTKEARLLFLKIMDGQVPHIDDALKKLRGDPEKYLAALSKLFPYFMPKKLDVTTDGQRIVANIQWLGDEQTKPEAEGGS